MSAVCILDQADTLARSTIDKLHMADTIDHVRMEVEYINTMKENGQLSETEMHDPVSYTHLTLPTI